MTKPHDVIVYGATGFTGGLVAQYLAAHPDVDVSRWALAGRNRSKLEAVRDGLAANHPELSALRIYIASASDPDSLADLAVRTRVVLTTVGPYETLGRPLVAACVEHGTDYVDLTGEPGFWHSIIAQYDDAARQSGALIVPCCGFDSIPHDVGARLVANALKDSGSGPIWVNGYVAAKGLPSGGTWQSALGIIADLDLGKMMGRSTSKRGSKRGPKRSGDDSKSGMHFSSDVARWVLPMPTIDPQVVRRSATLSDYGDGFGYHAWIETKSRFEAMQLLAGVGAVIVGAKVPVIRKLLGSLRPSGSGPSPQQRASSWFRVKVVGRRGSAKAIATMDGGDPGYDETAKMIAESALCLATERDALPIRGGVVTPAAAMGDRLVPRLRAAGLKITVTGPDASSDQAHAATRESA